MVHVLNAEENGTSAGGFNLRYIIATLTHILPFVYPIMNMFIQTRHIVIAEHDSSINNMQ